MKPIYPLRNPIREYAWGSTTAIADLLGLPPAESPQAELWLGAHPSAPSEIQDSEGAWHPLNQWVAEHRAEVLGAEVAEHWSHLPFLLKVLAAAKPLSIQAHPDAEQAQRGFAAEEAAGVPRDDAERNYPDGRHKPELIYALTPFSVLRGFRDPADIQARFEAAGLGDQPCVAELDSGPPETALRGFLRSYLEAPAADAALWVETALTEIGRRGAADDSEAWLPRLADEYGLDRGVLGPLYLHVFCLEPGEALYTGAGVLHAYLEGLGIELMASSDNVLRGGLTVKYVDPTELAKVVRYEATAPARTPGTSGGDGSASGEVRFETPAAEFCLSMLRPDGAELQVDGGVQILLCTAGGGEIRVGGESTRFTRGDSFLVPHVTGGYALSGDATVFRASVGTVDSA